MRQFENAATMAVAILAQVLVLAVVGLNPIA